MPVPESRMNRMTSHAGSRESNELNDLTWRGLSVPESTDRFMMPVPESRVNRMTSHGEVCRFPSRMIVKCQFPS
ncbi:hypothetical protein AMTR_s00025p00139660 [Amborella trichopoda]|uniref:Uncharacterized protein n=1 Tax=Amborella trichopoda TaxID=13333 RepID=W1PQW6_AMBTC|nr:hypothetical protein AMTR_s00025p00139660 [Amborella trichopoda]